MKKFTFILFVALSLTSAEAVLANDIDKTKKSGRERFSLTTKAGRDKQTFA